MELFTTSCHNRNFLLYGKTNFLTKTWTVFLGFAAPGFRLSPGTAIISLLSLFFMFFHFSKEWCNELAPMTSNNGTTTAVPQISNSIWNYLIRDRNNYYNNWDRKRHVTRKHLRKMTLELPILSVRVVSWQAFGQGNTNRVENFRSNFKR